jgi:hypothetical protein
MDDVMSKTICTMQKYNVLLKVRFRVQKTPLKRGVFCIRFCTFEKYETRSVKYKYNVIWGSH